MDIKKFFKRSDPLHSQLSALLSSPALQQELLGMRKLDMPSRDAQFSDSANLLNYTASTGYQVWAKEAWAKALSHLDAVMDERASADRVNYERAALRATLDLLRVSYQAQAVNEQLAKEIPSQNASLRR